MADLQPIIWARPARAARGPQPAFTLDAIARAAIAVADAEGLDALTMRRLATELGTGTMSLYRYVRGKQDVIDLMIDSAMGEIDLVAHERWRDGLTWYAHTLRAHGHRHPWLTLLPSTGPSFGPHAIAFTEHVLGLMAELDRPIDDVLGSINLVSAYTSGFVRDEISYAGRLAAEGASPEDWMALHGPYIRVLLDSGKYPLFNRMIIEAERPHMSADANFANGLDRLLDGLAASLSPSEDRIPEK